MIKVGKTIEVCQSKTTLQHAASRQRIGPLGRHQPPRHLSRPRRSPPRVSPNTRTRLHRHMRLISTESSLTTLPCTAITPICHQNLSAGRRNRPLNLTYLRRGCKTPAIQHDPLSNHRTPRSASPATNPEPANGQLEYVLDSADDLTAEDLWEMNRLCELLVGEVTRLKDDENGYGPKGKAFIGHVDVPVEVEAAAIRVRETLGVDR